MESDSLGKEEIIGMIRSKKCKILNRQLNLGKVTLGSFAILRRYLWV